jgi:hypothetical protein
MRDLEFRITGSQRRNLLTGTAVLILVAAMLGVAAALTHSGLGGPAAPYAVGAGLGALINFYAYVSYVMAYTECKPDGIRTRGLGGRRDCPWAQVRDIAPRISNLTVIVVVTTASGRRFWLGAPVDGKFVRDPEFANKLSEISGYWHMAALGWVGRGEAAERRGLGIRRSPDGDDSNVDIPWKAPPEFP